MKTIATTLAVALILGMNIGLVSSDDLPPSYTPSVHQVIVKQAKIYSAPVPLMRAIIACESSNDTKAVKITKREQSYGLVQINRLAHPEISIAQAEDPDFAVGYLAQQISTGHVSQWSCAHAKVN